MVDTEGKRLALESELKEEITFDGLSGEWKIYQRRRGHRYSTDDLLTAWYAIKKAVLPVSRMLDLGTGIGSVGLTCAWHFRNATLVGVEAQEISFRLLRENVWANECGDRVQIMHGDLRHTDAGTGFDLVTGSPPYFDIKKGIASEDSQKAHARFELRGDVRDYCLAAKRALRPGGRFVFCFPTNQMQRALDAIVEAGLHSHVRRDVVPRDGIAPLFSLFACAHEPAREVVEPPLLVRDKDGMRTDEMNAVRVDLGMPTKDRGRD